MQPRRPKHLHSNSFLGRNACGRGMQTSPTIDPRVRRYGNRKERLKEETKGEEERAGRRRFGVNTKRASGIPK